MPAFIISTSYTPYLKALCSLSGFPMDNVRCTDLSLDAWEMPEDEKVWLRAQSVSSWRRGSSTSLTSLSAADLRPPIKKAPPCSTTSSGGRWTVA